MDKMNEKWLDYKVLSTSNGEKLEKWGDVILLRPDPQVIWHGKTNLSKYPNLNAHYIRESTGGGHWQVHIPYPATWDIHYRDMTFCVKPMGFKHTGIFPEQAYNWDKMRDLIASANRPIKVLNLFAYSGGATVACTMGGAHVTHVDASKGMVELAKANMAKNNLTDKPVRYIVDDCFKFVEREIRRGNKYDAIIMDPPSFGRGPNGETWKLADNLHDFLLVCAKVLSDNPLFVLLNSYTTGLQPMALGNLLSLSFKEGNLSSYELGLPTDDGIMLPCGASAMIEYVK